MEFFALMAVAVSVIITGIVVIQLEKRKKRS